jgi:hypothetical protein
MKGGADTVEGRAGCSMDGAKGIKKNLRHLGQSIRDAPWQRAAEER